MNHPVIDTRLDTCQSPARAPCTAQPSTTISQGFCCPNLNHAGGYKVHGACCNYISVFLTLEKQVLGLQTVAGGGADGWDTWHVTRGCRPDTASPSAAGGGTWQLVEARYSWQHCIVRHVARDTCLPTDTATRARAAAGGSRANEAARARLFVFTLPSAEPERAEEAICMASLSHDAKNNSQLVTCPKK